MKKFVISMLIALIAPFMSINAQSINNYTEEQLKQAGGLENLLENNQKDLLKESKMYESFSKNTNKFKNANRVDKIEKYIESISIDNLLNNNSMLWSYTTDNKVCYENVCYFLISNSEVVQQENNYYCGPASVKQTLNFILGSSATQSQSYYANNMGTNSSNGTYVYKIKEELNNNQSVNDYGWREIVNGVDTFWDPVYYDSKTANVPLIARVDTGELNAYNDVSLTHYVTIIGYHKMDGKKIIYTDSYNGIDGVFGRKYDDIDNFYQATSYLIW